MGRRWGKSTLGGVLSLACAVRGAKVAWIVPTYKNGRPLWRWAEATATPLKLAGRIDISRSERTISVPGAGFLGIYSADNATALRGESFHLVIVDEAARVAEEVWTDVVQPTLADYDGRAILISTPLGRNWFYQEWQRGQGGSADVKSWTAPTSANPNPRIRRAAELARTRVNNTTYRQEWLAEFVEDGLTLFTLADIAAAERGADGHTPPERGHTYLTSVDIGRRRDATVINTVDTSVTPFQRVAFERIERVPYPKIQERIEARGRLYPGKVIIESNGPGDPVIENLKIKAEPFVTTARTKTQAIEALQLLLEQGQFKAVWDDRERAHLQRAAWDDDHTADEIMSLVIGAYHLVQPVHIPRTPQSASYVTY
jgi:hypothetical protein